MVLCGVLVRAIFLPGMTTVAVWVLFACWFLVCIVLIQSYGLRTCLLIGSVRFVCSPRRGLQSLITNCHRFVFTLIMVILIPMLGQLLLMACLLSPVASRGCRRGLLARLPLYPGLGFGRSMFLRRSEFLLGRGFSTLFQWLLCLRTVASPSLQCAVSVIVSRKRCSTASGIVLILAESGT